MIGLTLEAAGSFKAVTSRHEVVDGLHLEREVEQADRVRAIVGRVRPDL